MKQFLEMIQQQDFLVLDTETTGLHDGEICQIAIIDAKGEVLLDTYVHTNFPIPADETRIHGITDEMVKDAPTWRELLPLIHSVLNDRDVVVYNAVYDRKMMHQSSEKAGMEKIEWKEVARWWCAMEIYAEHYGEWNSYRGNCVWQKLGTAYYRLTGEQLAGAHSALTDCQATLVVCNAMVKERLTDERQSD